MGDVRDILVRKGNYVHGSFLKPESVDGYINGFNPGDREDSLGRFPFSVASVTDAVACARDGARAWRRVGLNDRAHAVRRFRDQLAQESERVARLLTRENGKPLWEARQEVVNTVHTIDLFLDDGMEMLAPMVLSEFARADFAPLGVVGLLCPYNLPVRLTGTVLAAAVLAGNAVVYKPSKFTPAIGQLLAELWDRCRLPRGVVNMVQGSGSVVGHALSVNDALGGLACVGSFETSQLLRRALFERPELPTIFQTGGKAMALVLEDADLQQAAYELTIGAFLTSGQRHDSTARVFVLSKVYEELSERLVEQASGLRAGYGFDDDVFMGPLISENFRTSYRKYLRRLTRAGHPALLEGGPLKTDKRGYYVKPAIHGVNWRGGSVALNSEPPGPVLMIYRVDSVEEAIQLHNQAAYRLTTSVFTAARGAKLHALSDALRTGSLQINRATINSSLRLPSAGQGRASSGHAAGLELVRALTQPRAQTIEVRPFDPERLLPGMAPRLKLEPLPAVNES